MDTRGDRTIDRQLADWVAADLISDEQARCIAAYEGQSGAVVPAGQGDRRSFTSPAEAIGYVGAALALGAIALMLGDLWRELLVAGRLALVAVLTLAMFGAGLALRSSGSRAMQRLTSVLFAATVAGVGWFVAVLTTDVWELTWSERPAVIAGAMALVALPLYVWRPRALPQLVLVGSLAVAAAASLDLVSPIEPGVSWRGLAVATVGVAWFLLAFGGWLAPRTVGEVSGAVVTSIGVQMASIGDARVIALCAGLVLAGVLVGLALRYDALHHLVIGALALFAFSPQLVFELFGDAMGAPATLLLIGILLVLLAVGLGRAGKEVRGGGPDVARASPPPFPAEGDRVEPVEEEAGERR